MADAERVASLVLEALAEHLEQVDAELPVPTSRDVVLYGPDAAVDSLGLVNVVVAVEDKLLDEFGQEVWLSDERALAQPVSPFRTVDSLTNYAVMLLSELGQ